MKTLEGQLMEQVQNNKRITLKPCTVLLSHYRFTWYLNSFSGSCHVFISRSLVIRALFFFMLMFSTLQINVHMLSLHSEPEKCFACMYLNAIAALPWSRCCFLHCGNTQWASRIGFSPHKPENNNSNNKDQTAAEYSTLLFFLLCPLQVYKSRWRPWRFGACCLPRVCTHGGSVLTQKHRCSRNDASGFQQTCGLIKQRSVEREEALSAVCGEFQLISGTNRNNGCNKSSTGWLQLALQV